MATYMSWFNNYSYNWVNKNTSEFFVPKLTCKKNCQAFIIDVSPGNSTQKKLSIIWILFQLWIGGQCKLWNRENTLIRIGISF